MTKINQGFPGSQIANHEVQTSRALVSCSSYNQLLGPPCFCTEPCPVELDDSSASRLCSPQLGMKPSGFPASRKPLKRGLLLLHSPGSANISAGAGNQDVAMQLQRGWLSHPRESLGVPSLLPQTRPLLPGHPSCLWRLRDTDCN